MVLHGVCPVRPSLYSKGGLSELFLIVHRLISMGASVCHPLLQGTATGPSSPCRWRHDCQYLSIPDVVQTLFLLELVLHLGRSAAPS